MLILHMIEKNIGISLVLSFVFCIFFTSCDTDKITLELQIAGDYASPQINTSFNTLNFPEKDSNGWTEVSPSPDTRRIHVSNDGDDSNDGLTEATAVATIDRAVTIMEESERNGYPDHLLLRKGDTWNESIDYWRLSGRSETEPMLISSYGSGARPLLTGYGRISFDGNDDVQHVWVIGIEFYCSMGDPSSPDFVPWDTPDYSRPTGIGFTGGGNDILIEDCKFSYHRGGGVIQRYESDGMTNIKIRRCVFANAYSTVSHSQGLYSYEVTGLLIEECIFDHNGWLVQGDGHNSQESGGATMFNHNTYINQCNQVYLLNNLFLRASSIGNKFNSDHPNESIEIVVNNNFYFDGEIGISLGGNTEEEYRFGNAEVINNVFTNIGRSMPTSRELSWGIDVKDNFNTTVAGNCILNQPYTGNSYAIQVSGRSNSDLQITNNLIYNINGSPLRIVNNPQFLQIMFSNNRIDNGGTDYRCLRSEYPLEIIVFSDNRYNSDNEEPFASLEIGYSDFDTWVAASGETGSSFGPLSYTDPARTLESYHLSINGSGVIEDFISEVKNQSKDHWDTRYTASAINNYFREGYDVEMVDSVYLY